jgi:cysteine desulfurase/selenocysteine lyase
LLTKQVKIFSMVHISNSLGTLNPVVELCARARKLGIITLVDGAQSAGHMPVDVQAIGCDFFAFSGHKICGPTGIGVLWGRQELLDAMPPYQGGGEMISAVTFEKTFYKGLPAKFEAGTPNITGVVGLGAAIDYVNTVGLEAIGAYEHELLVYATEQLRSIPQVRIIGTAREKAAGQPAQHRAERKGGNLGAEDIDADNAGCKFVIAHCAHGAPKPRIR